MKDDRRRELEKNVRRLILAASDMDQAVAAAKARQVELDGVLARALETAMVVCYMRPFKASPQRSGDYVPSAGDDATMHAELKFLRDKAHAHNDDASGRWAVVEVAPPGADNIVTVTWREEWPPYPDEKLPFVIALCERLAERLRNDAGATQMVLDGLADDAQFGA
jgi:hypothetical protein